MGHPGNRRLRSMVERQRKAFVEAAKRKEKRKIAMDIIQEIQTLQPPGRFLTEDPQGKAGGGSHKDAHASVALDGVHISVLNKAWVRVEPHKALTKVMHRLREKETGCGSDIVRQIEMRNQQKELPEQGEEVQHPSGTKSVKAGFLTAQLPQLLTDEPDVTNANITDSTTMPLGIFPHQHRPRDQLNPNGFFNQIPPETHVHSGGEVYNNNQVDLDGVLSFLNFAMQNQGGGLRENTGHIYPNVRHFRHP